MATSSLSGTLRSCSDGRNTAGSAHAPSARSAASALRAGSGAPVCAEPLVGTIEPSTWRFHASHGTISSAASAQAASTRGLRHAATAASATANSAASIRVQTSRPSSTPTPATRRAVHGRSSSSTSTAAARTTSSSPVSRPLWWMRSTLTEPAATTAASTAARSPRSPWRRAVRRAISATSTMNAAHRSVPSHRLSRRPS
jgi:hypothetical protein